VAWHVGGPHLLERLPIVLFRTSQTVEAVKAVETIATFSAFGTGCSGFAGIAAETKRDNHYLLLVPHRYSKITRATPLKRITAAEVANIFVDLWIGCHGIPVFLLSDNGSQLHSQIFQRVTQVLGISQLFTSAYKPSTNGQTDRYNSTILESCVYMKVQTTMTGTKP
jgi:hypothetical protein